MTFSIVKGLSVKGKSVSVTPIAARSSKDVKYRSIGYAHSGRYTANNYIEGENSSDDSDLSANRSRKRGSVSQKRSEGPATDRATSLHGMVASQKQKCTIELLNPEEELSTLLQRLSFGTSFEYRIPNRGEGISNPGIHPK